MEMAFHEGFKQLQAQVTRQKSTGTIECGEPRVVKQKSTGTEEYNEEGGKVESSLSPWRIASGSSTIATKVEAPAGRSKEWR